MNATNDLQIERIATESGLITLCEEWSALRARCPTATPFQTPEWLIPWWRCLGAGSLWALALRRHGELVGLFPYCIPDASRRLFLMGTGVTDYLDILIDPAYEREGMALMFDFLRCERDAWERGDFQELRQDSQLLKNAFPEDFRAAAAPCSVCPVVTLPETVQEFYTGLSSRHRRHINLTKKKINEANTISLLMAQEHTLGEFLADLFRLHKSRWNERDMPGVLADEKIREFHRQAAAGFLAKGQLYLYCMKFNDTTAACIYAIRGNGRLYSYIGGFDPALERLSPGIIALDLVIDDSILKGIHEFDFLRGAEPYKYLWGARDRSNYRITFHHPAPRSKEAAL